MRVPIVMRVTAMVVAITAALQVPVQAHQVRTIPVVADSDRSFIGTGDCDGTPGTSAGDVLKVSLYLNDDIDLSTSEFLRCDVDWNGRIDQVDVNMIKNASVGLIKLPVARYKKGDANGDGQVTTADALLVASYLQHTTETYRTVFGAIIAAIIDILTAMRKTRVYNADCNTNGVINNKDVKGALNLAVGLACQ